MEINTEMSYAIQNLTTQRPARQLNDIAELWGSKEFIDLLAIWVLLYFLLQNVRGTRSVDITKGFALILLIQIITRSITLQALSDILNEVMGYGQITIIVIFQPEIRKVLEKLGRNMSINKKVVSLNEKIVASVGRSIQFMAGRKIGALITFQRGVSLEEYIATGIALNAEITEELLTNIFMPNAPLHDGAVIIRNGMIAAASAYLPSTDNREIPKRFGTRHRAAIGISEVSDAVTIVVSEETGEVSMTVNNKFLDDLSLEEVLDILRRELAGKEDNLV